MVLFHWNKKLRWSSNYKERGRLSFKGAIDVVFHISSSWVKIMLHSENQRLRLPKTAIFGNHPKCGGMVLCGFSTNTDTNTKLVLSCFGLFVGGIPTDT